MKIGIVVVNLDNIDNRAHALDKGHEYGKQGYQDLQFIEVEGKDYALFAEEKGWLTFERKHKFIKVGSYSEDGVDFVVEVDNCGTN